MDLIAASLGDLITMVGRSVADGQQTIDRRVLEHFSAIYDQNASAFEPLRAIGYQPTWYQISEATAEIAIAMTATRAGAESSLGSRRHDVRAAPVDASYASRFRFSHRAASSLKFRIVPVPPPAAVTVPEARSL